ncbi:MAG: protein phosphatase 2C domain-containing protein [Spirochaetaceae bacterium]|jgi:serine/threonine protein phosphatase PrpC|nr:protein phosphatase 2C domain-containing protein [Spirochaetaceae bacterium]
MTVWKSFGASVIGPGHIRARKPNQDAWLAFHHTWGDGIAVSDGLGSKALSEFGSYAACLAAASAVHACRDMAEMEYTFPFDRIKKNWLSLIAPLDSHDCSATCLLVFRLADGIIRTGMIGDGLIAILKTDGAVLSLTENKTSGFSNVTSALSKNSTDKEWRFLDIQENICRAVVICTDGVSDDLEDADGFIREFVEHSADLACVSAARNTRNMLENWPTPGHSDDKTIVCLFRDEAGDE